MRHRTLKSTLFEVTVSLLLLPFLRKNSSIKKRKELLKMQWREDARTFHIYLLQNPWPPLTWKSLKQIGKSFAWCYYMAAESEGLFILHNKRIWTMKSWLHKPGYAWALCVPSFNPFLFFRFIEKRVTKPPIGSNWGNCA